MKTSKMSLAAQKAWLTRRKDKQKFPVTIKQPNSSQGFTIKAEELSPGKKAWLTRMGSRAKEPMQRFRKVQWFVAKDNKGKALSYCAAENEPQAHQLLLKDFPKAQVSLCPGGKCPF